MRLAFFMIDSTYPPIKYCTSYSVCLSLTYLSIVPLRPTHIVTTAGFLFLSRGRITFPYVFIHRNFFIHSSVGGHVGCCHVSAIVKNAAVNVGVHVALPYTVFVSLGYIPRRGIARSYASSMFNSFRNFHLVSNFIVAATTVYKGFLILTSSLTFTSPLLF